jgi:glucose-6-phosphate 1-dehydrogenase
MDLETVELDLNYASKYSEEEMTGPYERLLLSILNDKEVSHFVGRKELKHSWELFTPLLEGLEKRKPLNYTFGSLGPKEADDLCQKYGFELSEEFPW